MSRLPLPAPLPPRTTAFSRRAALFGAVLSTGALAGSASKAYGPSDLSAFRFNLHRNAEPAAPVALADADLAILADVMARAQRAGKSAEAVFGASYHEAPEWQGAIGAFYDAAVLMRDTPAASHDGVNAKARAMALPWLSSDPETAAGIGASLAADVLRLGEVAHG